MRASGTRRTKSKAARQGVAQCCPCPLQQVTTVLVSRQSGQAKGVANHRTSGKVGDRCHGGDRSLDAGRAAACHIPQERVVHTRHDSGHWSFRKIVARLPALEWQYLPARAKRSVSVPSTSERSHTQLPTWQNTEFTEAIVQETSMTHTCM